MCALVCYFGGYLKNLNVAPMRLDSVPNITLPSYKNGKISKASIGSLVSDYLVLVFYPYDFTTVCPTEINEFTNRCDEFVQAKANIAFVSCDSVYSHEAWSRIRVSDGGVEGVKCAMLSDYNKDLSAALNLLSEDGASRRATVIIDKDMKIRHYSYNDNSVGRSVVEVLRLLNAISFCDKNGGMCIVNWEKTAAPTNK